MTVNLKERRGKGRHNEVVTTQRIPLELKTGKMFSKLGTIEHRAQVKGNIITRQAECDACSLLARENGLSF